MKVVVVLTQPPLLEGGAPGRCAVALIRGLRSHGVEVEALAARHTFGVPGDPPADLRVEVVPVDPPGPGWRGRLGRLRRPRGDLVQGELVERVRAAAARADVVHLEETETSWADEGVSTPSLVHIQYLVRRDRSLPAPWTQPFRDYVELARAERAAIRRHRWIVASSPLVADAIRSVASHAHVVVAPLSLDPAHYSTALLEDPPVGGVIGTAAWPPTARAMTRLLERDWPKIKASAPAARLLVAGRGTERFRTSDPRPGAEIVGEVPSGASFLRELSVLLYPIDRGSGMKVKVLEAMATGLPVVTTSPGAEGIAANDGVVVVHTEREFVERSVSILLDPEERRERGRVARATFERLYSPRPATEPLVELYTRMLESRA